MPSRLIVLICFLLPALAAAQIELAGNVHDQEGLSLSGARVYVVGTFDGALTDSLGNFTFTTQARDSAVIAVKLAGYESARLVRDLRADTELALTLKVQEAQLREVVITAGVFEASAKKRSVLLRPLDIVSTAGAMADIPATINTLPGTQRVGESGQLFVRGGAADETAVYIDGLRAPHFYTPRLPNLAARGRFSPFLFEGTYFSSGGYGPEYGQSMSGVLNLETVGLADNSSTALSVSSVGASAAHTQRWERTSLTGELNVTQLGPYYAVVPQRPDWQQVPDGITSQLVFRHQEENGALWKGLGQVNRGRGSAIFPGMRSAVGNENEQYYGSLTQTRPIGSGVLYVGFAASHDVQRTTFPGGTAREQSDFGQLRTEWRRSYGKVHLSTGATAWWQRHDDAVQWEGTDEQRLQRVEPLVATYARADWKPGKHWAVRSGLRVEREFSLSGTQLNPSLSVARRAGKHGQVSVAMGRYTQRPAWALRRAFPDWETQRAEHLIVNYQWEHERRSFRVEAYGKRYQNLPQFNALTPEAATEFGQGGGGYARGVDVFWRDEKTFKYVDYWLSYSLLDTRRTFGPHATAVVPTFASRHNFNAVAKRYFPKLKTQMGMTYSFTSPRPYAHPAEATYPAGHTPAFHDLSFNASYLFDLFGHFTVLHVAVSNLLGSEQIFGYRHVAQPDGSFLAFPIQPPAPRFFFVGLFVSIDG